MPVTTAYQTITNPTSIERQRVEPTDKVERRRRYLLRWITLKGERSRQWTKWQELSDYILPERGRFLTTDHNKPKDTSKILNNAPTRAARSLAAMLMSGVTNPARPWFNLTLNDPAAAKWGPAKEYLYEYAERMRRVLEFGGFYRAAAMGVYPDLVNFGTACCFVEEDPIRVIRFLPMPLGSYALAQDGKGRIDTVAHEEAWTVAELIKEFGWNAVSNSVKLAYNAGLYEQYVLVLHVVEPQAEFIPGRADYSGKRWGSVWMEIGGLNQASGALQQPSTDPAIGFLRESGYEEFPALTPRWQTIGRDVYGTGPGHDALPDAKQLMVLEKRSLLIAAKLGNPPMLFPDTMRNSKLSMLPGDPVYIPAGMNQKVEPAQVVNPQAIPAMENEKRQAEMRINESFFGNLSAMFVQDTRIQPRTAAEINAKNQEKMLLLGPVLENINDEFLMPLIDRVAGIMERRGLVPIPPPELQGMPIKVEFTSILAQAQKLIGTTAKERLVVFTGQMAQLKGPDVLDLIDADELVRGYADDLGVPPDALEEEKEVEQARAQRAAQQQAQQQGAALMAATEGAKNLAASPTAEPNLLTKLIGPQGAAMAGGEDQNAIE